MDLVTAYIVHTADNDRSQGLIRQINSLGLPHKKIESLSSRRDSDVLSKMHKGRNTYELTVGRDLLLGEIGGSFGHQKALAHFLLDLGDWALILEDDAVWTGAEIPWNSIFGNLPKGGPALINLGDPMRVLFKRSRLSSSCLVELHMPSLLAHAYLINRQAAFFFFKNFNNYGITSVPDWPYPQPRKISFFLTKKTYFTQQPLSESSFSLTSERRLTHLLSSEQALTMPIPPYRLLQRIMDLRTAGFKLIDILHHEVILRYKVRLSLLRKRSSRKIRNLSH